MHAADRSAAGKGDFMNVKKSYTEEFSRRLLALIAARKVRPSKLAKDIGVHDRTVYQWLRGTYAPNHYGMAQLCDYFGVTREFLTGGKEDGRETD